MQPVSNTAKAQMIEYLTQLFNPHQEAINALFISAKETVEGFIADKADEVANISVTATECSSMIHICITAELNERSGIASMFINSSGHKLIDIHERADNDGAIAAGKVAQMLGSDFEFVKYAESIAAQYRIDYAPFCSYMGTIRCIKKSMDAGN